MSGAKEIRPTPENQQGAAEEEQLAVHMQGCELEPEEMAALAAALTQLQAQCGGALPAAGAPHGAGAGRGPRAARPDRTLSRRADLGLWARPGADQWRRAEGWR